MLGRGERLDGNATNAALSWALVAVLVASVAESLLDGDPLWAGFSVAVIAVVLAPAAAARSPVVLVDWKLLLLSALPAIARTVDAAVDAVTYASIAALALLIVAEIDAFTRARLTPRFAALTVALATLSVASTWAVVQYAADVYLGTSYLGDVPELMWSLVVASAVGVVAAVVFERYCAHESLSRVLDGGA